MAGNMARKQQRRAASRTRWAVKASHEGLKDAMHTTRKAGEGVRGRASAAMRHVFRGLRRPIRAAARPLHLQQEQRG